MLFTTNNKQQTTNNKQQTTNNKQQTTNNKQQTTNNKQQTTNNKYAIGPNFGNYTIAPGTIKYKSFDEFYNREQIDKVKYKNLSEKIASLGIDEMKALISETKNTSNNISTSTNISKGLKNALWDHMKWYQYIFTIFFGNNESIIAALLNLENTIVDSMFQKIKNQTNILGTLSKTQLLMNANKH